ncbi:MAG: ribosome maturation factor RimM [Anaerolineae bacterium]
MPPAFIAVGMVRRPHGLNGEVQVEVLTDFPEERFQPGATVFLGGDDPARGDGPAPATVASVRAHDRLLLVRFRDVTERDGATALRGRTIYVPAAEVVPLDDEDSYYPHELIGASVVTTDGAPVGRVVDLMNAGASDILVVRGERQVLVPMIGDVIHKVDVQAGRIEIVAVPGLLDEG